MGERLPSLKKDILNKVHLWQVTALCVLSLTLLTGCNSAANTLPQNPNNKNTADYSELVLLYSEGYGREHALMEKYTIGTLTVEDIRDYERWILSSQVNDKTDAALRDKKNFQLRRILFQAGLPLSRYSRFPSMDFEVDVYNPYACDMKRAEMRDAQLGIFPTDPSMYVASGSKGEPCKLARTSAISYLYSQLYNKNLN